MVALFKKGIHRGVLPDRTRRRKDNNTVPSRFHDIESSPFRQLLNAPKSNCLFHQTHPYNVV